MYSSVVEMTESGVRGGIVDFVTVSGSLSFFPRATSPGNDFLVAASLQDCRWLHRCGVFEGAPGDPPPQSSERMGTWMRRTRFLPDEVSIGSRMAFIPEI